MKVVMRSVAAAGIFIALAACAGNRPDPVVGRSDDTFYQMTRPIMTVREERIYRNLSSPEARRRFIDYFWEIRDPNPLTEDNEFRAEIRDRFEYVERFFREGQRPGWRTDRGRFFMILGEPEQVDRNVEVTDSRYKGRIIDWYYGFSGVSGTTYSGGGFRLRFVDEKGFGVYRLDERYLSLRVLDLLEELKLNMIVKRDEDSPFPPAMKFKVDYEPAANRVTVLFGPGKISFARRGDRVRVHFHVDILAYGKKDEIAKFSREWSREYAAAELLEPDFRFAIPVDVDLKPGRHTLDVVVTDVMSGRKSRGQAVIKR